MANFQLTCTSFSIILDLTVNGHRMHYSVTNNEE